MFAPQFRAHKILAGPATFADDFGDGCDGQRAGRLDDRAGLFEQGLDRRARLVGVDRDDLIDMLATDPVGLFADAPYGYAIGETADAIERDRAAILECGLHARCVGRLDTNDAHGRCLGLDPARDAGRQPAAADRNEDRVWRALALLEDLLADGALTGDNQRIVKRMHEHPLFTGRQFAGVGLCFVVGIAEQDDVATELANSIAFYGWCRYRHDDLCRDTAPFRRQRDALGMVTGR